jgi:hypothetical protein
LLAEKLSTKMPRGFRNVVHTRKKRKVEDKEARMGRK